ncbi:hypothetical protein MMC19_001194 [Ptychographa xylographoides]|nr:hypothetical protein [Ptychographa xylographoides]
MDELEVCPLLAALLQKLTDQQFKKNLTEYLQSGVSTDVLQARAQAQFELGQATIPVPATTPENKGIGKPSIEDRLMSRFFPSSSNIKSSPTSPPPPVIAGSRPTSVEPKPKRARKKPAVTKKETPKDSGRKYPTRPRTRGQERLVGKENTVKAAKNDKDDEVMNTPRPGSQQSLTLE